MPRGLNPYDEAVLQRRLWTPNLLRTALWLDADDLSTISTATGVNEWRDKSGNGRNFTQGTGGTQPTFTQNGLNGRPVLSFNGSQWLTSINTAATWNFLHNTNGSSVFAVWKAGNVSDPNTLYALLGTSAIATANHGFSIFFDDRVTSLRNERLGTQTVRGVSGTTSGTNFTADLAHPPNTPTLISSVNDPGNATAANRLSTKINGGAEIKNNIETLAASSSDASFTLQIGTGGNTVVPLVGYIAEIVILSSIATNTVRGKVEGYLAWKWGLQNRLSAVNSFCNRPPLIGD
jgi:hypothetical protein